MMIVDEFTAIMVVPKMPGWSVFLTKTFNIFSNTEYSEWCEWGPNGDTIVFKSVSYISSKV
jgi:hypothetical protein